MFMGTAVAASFRPLWLRSARFDLSFILGIAGVGLLAGVVVGVRPELFVPLFMLDVWLLGYHHVIATFTRLTFDRDSFQENQALVLILPIAVAAAVGIVIWNYGLLPITTIYFHWQWWHYTRQSEGISKAFRGRNRDRDAGDDRLARLAFYSVPVAGIVTASARQPDEFLFVPIWTLPVPWAVAHLVQGAAVVLVGLWAFQQWRAYRLGHLAETYVLYVLTHFAIYASAYVWFANISHGWLVINIWHNAQYIAFVWMFNNRRFSAGVHPTHQFLSTISQSRNWWLYLLTCLTISSAFYYLTNNVLGLVASASVAYVAAFYQAVNFHHYIVDSKIWKLRKPTLRTTLGIS
jgi:hypothetical protein